MWGWGFIVVLRCRNLGVHGLCARVVLLLFSLLRVSLRIFVLPRRRALALGWLQVVSSCRSPDLCLLGLLQHAARTFWCAQWFSNLTSHRSVTFLHFFGGNDVVLECALRILFGHADVASSQSVWHSYSSGGVLLLRLRV